MISQSKKLTFFNIYLINSITKQKKTQKLKNLYII